MFSMMNISGSALTAHKTMLETVSNNLANINTPAAPGEETYKRQAVLFEECKDMALKELGVKVKEIIQEDREDNMVHQPNHPYANEEGYVRYADIDLSEEMADMMIAQRGYNLNINALNYIRKMYEQTLEIGK